MDRTSDKAAHWAEVIRRYRHSGLTQAQFCRENDLSYHSLRWWLHQPRARRAIEALRETTGHKALPKAQASTRSETARFLPVRIVETLADREPQRPLAVSPPPIQVLLGGGWRIAVGPGFNPDVLRRMVAALELP
jgi:hypothetical protein